jgi:hypothetical protein
MTSSQDVAALPKEAVIGYSLRTVKQKSPAEAEPYK